MAFKTKEERSNHTAEVAMGNVATTRYESETTRVTGQVIRRRRRRFERVLSEKREKDSPKIEDGKKTSAKIPISLTLEEGGFIEVHKVAKQMEEALGAGAIIEVDRLGRREIGHLIRSEAAPSGFTLVREDGLQTLIDKHDRIRATGGDIEEAPDLIRTSTAVKRRKLPSVRPARKSTQTIPTTLTKDKKRELEQAVERSGVELSENSEGIWTEAKNVRAHLELAAHRETMIEVMKGGERHRGTVIERRGRSTTGFSVCTAEGRKIAIDKEDRVRTIQRNKTEPKETKPREEKKKITQDEKNLGLGEFLIAAAREGHNELGRIRTLAATLTRVSYKKIEKEIQKIRESGNTDASDYLEELLEFQKCKKKRTEVTSREEFAKKKQLGRIPPLQYINSLLRNAETGIRIKKLPEKGDRPHENPQMIFGPAAFKEASEASKNLRSIHQEALEIAQQLEHENSQMIVRALAYQYYGVTIEDLETLPLENSEWINQSLRMSLLTTRRELEKYGLTIRVHENIAVLDRSNSRKPLEIVADKTDCLAYNDQRFQEHLSINPKEALTNAKTKIHSGKEKERRRLKRIEADKLKKKISKAIKLSQEEAQKTNAVLEKIGNDDEDTPAKELLATAISAHKQATKSLNIITTQREIAEAANIELTEKGRAEINLQDIHKAETEVKQALARASSVIKIFTESIQRELEIEQTLELAEEASGKLEETYKEVEAIYQSFEAAYDTIMSSETNSLETMETQLEVARKEWAKIRGKIQRVKKQLEIARKAKGLNGEIQELLDRAETKSQATKDLNSKAKKQYAEARERVRKWIRARSLRIQTLKKTRENEFTEGVNGYLDEVRKSKKPDREKAIKECLKATHREILFVIEQLKESAPEAATLIKDIWAITRGNIEAINIPLNEIPDITEIEAKETPNARILSEAMQRQINKFAEEKDVKPKQVIETINEALATIRISRRQKKEGVTHIELVRIPQRTATGFEDISKLMRSTEIKVEQSVPTYLESTHRDAVETALNHRNPYNNPHANGRMLLSALLDFPQGVTRDQLSKLPIKYTSKGDRDLDNLIEKVNEALEAKRKNIRIVARNNLVFLRKTGTKPTLVNLSRTQSTEKHPLRTHLQERLAA